MANDILRSAWGPRAVSSASTVVLAMLLLAALSGWRQRPLTTALVTWVPALL